MKLLSERRIVVGVILQCSAASSETAAESMVLVALIEGT